MQKIRAHRGIIGNEEVDKLAEQSSEVGNIQGPNIEKPHHKINDYIL